MPCWYFDKKELKSTPSSADGIDYETECRYRKEGARFIIDTCKKMGLGCYTIHTGAVYFHRFYMFQSFRHFPRYVTACCCLFLAGKVEETPKKCNDIIEHARAILSPQKFDTFGEDPKEEVMTLERILLQTIKFDLRVEHPYSYLVKYTNCFKGDKKKKEKMLQMAWTFVNDSLCTTLALQWEPEIIAVALMYLAGKLSKFEVVDWVGRTSKHLRWWDMFVEDVTMDLLEDICHQVLDLYSQPVPSQPPESPPLNVQPGTTLSSTTPPMIKSIKIEEHVEETEAVLPPSAIKPVVPPEIQHYTYQNFPAPPLSTYPPTFTTPISTVVPPPTLLAAPSPGPPPPHIPPPPPAGHITAPPPSVFPSFVTAPPPHFAPVVTGPPPFFQPPMAGQPHRPYYPPPN